MEGTPKKRGTFHSYIYNMLIISLLYLAAWKVSKHYFLTLPVK